MEIKDNNGIKLYCFSKKRHKDHDCLDICKLADAREDISQNPPYREAYYCFFLSEKGSSDITIGGQSGTAEMSTIFCGLPGELWKWKQPLDMDAEGRFLFFEPEFLLAPYRQSSISIMPSAAAQISHTNFYSKNWGNQILFVILRTQ